MCLFSFNEWRSVRNAYKIKIIYGSAVIIKCKSKIFTINCRRNETEKSGSYVNIYQGPYYM